MTYLQRGQAAVIRMKPNFVHVPTFAMAYALPVFDGKDITLTEDEMTLALPWALFCRDIRELEKRGVDLPLRVEEVLVADRSPVLAKG